MATKSIGLSGRDFSTLSAWSSYVNALALTAPELGEVYNDGGPVTETVAVVIGGWTGGSSTNTVTLHAASGQGFKDNASASTNALRWNSSVGAALTSNVDGATAGSYQFKGSYLIVDGLMFRCNQVGGGSTAGFVMTTGNNITLKNCIFDSSATLGAIFNPSLGTGCAIQNTIVICRNGNGCLFQGANTVTIDGCTFAGIGGGSNGVAAQYSATILLRNTAIMGFTADTYATGATISSSSVNNATSHSSFTVSNAAGGTPVYSITSADFISITSGSEDLRISSGSKLKDAGATVGLTVDILGTARPQGSAYDIGAYEYVTGGGSVPNLSSGTSSSTGSTTGTFGATTDTGSGTMYGILSLSATAPSVAQIQAGQNAAGASAPWSGNQSITSTGAKSFSATGLTASTTYYPYVQQHASSGDSTVLSGPSFTTSSGGDTTPPTLTGSISVSNLTTTSYTLTWPAGSDNVAVTNYDYSLDNGTTYTTIGNVLTVNISGRTAGTTDQVKVRARDGAGNVSTPPIATSVTLNTAGTITTLPLKNNTGTLLTTETAATMYVYALTGALVLTKTGLATNATTGVMTFSDALIATGTTYRIVIVLSGGGEGLDHVTAT